jgi:hypothetical protein
VVYWVMAFKLQPQSHVVRHIRPRKAGRAIHLESSKPRVVAGSGATSGSATGSVGSPGSVGVGGKTKGSWVTRRLQLVFRNVSTQSRSPIRWPCLQETCQTKPNAHRVLPHSLYAISLSRNYYQLQPARIAFAVKKARWCSLNVRCAIKGLNPTERGLQCRNSPGCFWPRPSFPIP